MALVECKECGREVSKKAASCAHCGAPNKKKTSLFTWLFLVLLVLIGIGFFSQPSSQTPSRSVKASVLDALGISYTWSKDGFDNIMKGNFTIHNSSSHDVKDIEITCAHLAKSGTQIDRNTRTIYEIIKAGSTRKFADFNMGFTTLSDKYYLVQDN